MISNRIARPLLIRLSDPPLMANSNQTFTNILRPVQIVKNKLSPAQVLPTTAVVFRAHQ